MAVVCSTMPSSAEGPGDVADPKIGLLSLIPSNKTPHILRLPTELLLEIFAELTRYTRHPKHYKSLYTTLALAQVCRRWRLVCQASPELWTCIHIPQTISVPALEEYLCRSRDRPLDIRIGHKNSTLSPPIRKRISAPALDLLLTSCHRWRSFELRVRYTSFLRLTARMKGNLPFLSRLVLDISGDELFTRTRIDTFSECHLLTDVSVSGISSARLDLPWSSVQTYHSPCAVEDIDREVILAEGHNLQQCTFTVLNHTRRDDLSSQSSPIPRNTHHHLRALHYSTNDRDGLGWLRNWTFPALEHLCVRVTHTALLPRHLDGIHSMILQSACALVHLEISGLLAYMPECVEFLRCVPGVRTLRVSSQWYHMHGFFEALAYPSDAEEEEAGVVLPNLERLILSFPSTGGYQEKASVALVDLVKSRRRKMAVGPDGRRPASLTSFVCMLGGEAAWKDSVYSRFKDVEADGFDMTLV